MQKDDIIIESLRLIRKQVKDKYDLDISEEEIHDIVESQIKGAVFGFKKGVSVKLPVFGKFLFIDRKKTSEEIYKLYKVKEYYSEVEYERAILEGKLQTIKRNKNRWLKEKKERPTIIEVIKKPNISTSKIIYDRLSKLLAIERDSDIDNDNVDNYINGE